MIFTACVRREPNYNHGTAATYTYTSCIATTAESKQDIRLKMAHHSRTCSKVIST